MRVYLKLSSRLVAVLTLLLLCCPAPGFSAPRAGQAAPEFRVPTIAGQHVSLGSFRGKVVVIDFFATWCQPCRAAIPHLNEWSRTYGGQGLQVLGLSADEDGEKGVKVFAERNGISYPVALAGETVLADYSIRSVPIMILIDRKGKVAEIMRGYGPEVIRTAEQHIKRLLAEK